MNSSRGILVAILLLLAPATARADWTPPGNNVVVYGATQELAGNVPDGAGGAILLYHDTRNQVQFVNPCTDVYGQHVKVDGTLAPGWTIEGSEVFRNNSRMTFLRAIPDGQGGAFTTALMSYDAVGGVGTASVFHHVTKDGPPASPFGFFLESEMGAGGGGLAPDGNGGIYVAAHDARAACESEDCQLKVYVGRYDAALYPVSGWPLRVRAGSGMQVNPDLASDGAQGVYIVWFDARVAPGDLYVQHVLPNATRDPAWSADGVALGATPATIDRQRAIPDGAGGVYVAWTDRRASGRNELYLQRLDATGTRASGWPDGGRLVASIPGVNVGAFTVHSDGALGTFLTWNEAPPSGPAPLRAIRLDANGAPVPGWPADGRVLSTVGSTNAFPPATAPGVSHDLFVVAYTPDGYRVFRIDGAGADVPGWPAAMEVGGYWTLAPDPWGGVIASWNVYDIYGADIRSLRIGPDGAIGSLVGVPTLPAQGPDWALGPALPNPARGGMTCMLTLPAAARVDARVFDVRGSLVRTIASGEMLAAGSRRLSWDGADARGGAAPGGLYYLSVRVDGRERVARIVRL